MAASRGQESRDDWKPERHPPELLGSCRWVNDVLFRAIELLHARATQLLREPALCSAPSGPPATSPDEFLIGSTKRRLVEAPAARVRIGDAFQAVLPECAHGPTEDRGEELVVVTEAMLHPSNRHELAGTMVGREPLAPLAVSGGGKRRPSQNGTRTATKRKRGAPMAESREALGWPLAPAAAHVVPAALAAALADVVFAETRSDVTRLECMELMDASW